MSSLEIGQQCKGKVEKLVYGGAGLLRNNGIVVFVFDVLPEEEITYEITTVKKRYAEGRLISVETPSPKRVKPRCPHFGVCGGCQLQHADSPCHALIKKEWLREAMHGLLAEGMTYDVVPAVNVWAWRRKITLHATSEPKLGYFARDNATLISIQKCPIFFHEGEEQILSRLKNSIQCIKSPFHEITVTLFRLEDRSLCVVMKGSQGLSSGEKLQLIEKIGEVTATFSLCFSGWRHDVGTHDFLLHALDKEWFFSLNAFIQNHPIQSEILWKDLLRLFEGEERATLFDLYSGVGVTAIELASRGHIVYAIEASRDAVKAAQRSASSRGVSLELRCGKVEDVLPRLPIQASVWIVNPPRTGLSPKARELMKKAQPKRIIYVSCSPGTMARDIADCKENYKVQWIRGYDMFPQTTHLETLALLTRF